MVWIGLGIILVIFIVIFYPQKVILDSKFKNASVKMLKDGKFQITFGDGEQFIGHPNEWDTDPETKEKLFIITSRYLYEQQQ